MNAPIYLALLVVLLSAALPLLRDAVVGFVERSAQAALAPPPAARPRLEATLGCRGDLRRRVHRRRSVTGA